MRAIATACGVVLAAVVLGLFLAAQWAATTYSYSEKLFGTGLILAMGVPAAAGAISLLRDFLPEDKR